MKPDEKMPLTDDSIGASASQRKADIPSPSPEDGDPHDRAARLARQIALIGTEADERLARASVTVFGAGGVGGAVIEALARAGVGSITVVDFDVFSVSNLNRQILCTAAELGRRKAEVAAQRVRSVFPDCNVRWIDAFVTAENADALVTSGQPDFVCDAVDNVTAKLALISACAAHGIPVVSSMGTGNKLDPTRFRIDRIDRTSVCPLARVMRRELKARGLCDTPVLYSTEEPVRTGMRTPASISFVPSAAGLILAGYIIRRLAQL